MGTLTFIAGCGVIIGRVLDVYGNFLNFATIRWGMAIVAISCLIPSLYGIYTLVHFAFYGIGGRLRENISSIVLHNAIRIGCIQLIDVGEILTFLVMRTNFDTLTWVWVFDNLDNCRALLLCMDVIYNHMMEASARHSSANQKKTILEFEKTTRGPVAGLNPTPSSANSANE